MSRLVAVVVLLVVVGLVVLAIRTGRTGRSSVAVGAPTFSTPPVTASPTAAPTADPTASPTASPTVVPTPEALPSPTTTVARPAIPDLGPHLPLLATDGWINTDVTALQQLRGRVVVVQFWTFGCSNCRATLPNLIDLYARWPRDQVEIVGIHAPEFDHEADPDAVAAAAAELGVTWPIVLDTDKITFHAWQPGSTAYWPRTYVLDRAGHVRFDHIGEGAYQELQDTVAALVADPTL